MNEARWSRLEDRLLGRANMAIAYDKIHSKMVLPVARSANMDVAFGVALQAMS